MRFVCLVLAASCAAAAPRPIANQPTHPAPPATPAPTLQLARDQFELSRAFPLMSADGAVVVLAVEDSDGGRGYPNLRFVVKNRRDKVLATHVVLAADEADGYLGDAALAKRLAPRIERANAWLAKQHATYDLRPLARDTLAVTWEKSTLDIAAGATPLVHRATPPDWLAETSRMPDGSGEMCENPAFLDGAIVDAAHRIAVVTVRYEGTDTCWEPPDQQRVVTW